MAELYNEQGAPGLIIYNAVMGAPDKLLSSSVEHLQTAYAVDVIGAIVVTQVAAPAMRAAGSGTIIVTGGGFADHPIPALATVSLGKAALRSAATMLGADLEPDGIRVATLTIAGQIVAGTAFDPENIATALLGGRPFRRSLAGGVSLYRRIGLEMRTVRSSSSSSDRIADAEGSSQLLPSSCLGVFSQGSESCRPAEPEGNSARERRFSGSPAAWRAKGRAVCPSFAVT